MKLQLKMSLRIGHLELDHDLRQQLPMRKIQTMKLRDEVEELQEAVP